MVFHPLDKIPPLPKYTQGGTVMQETGYGELQPLDIVEDRTDGQKMLDGDMPWDTDHKVVDGVPYKRRTKGQKEWWVIDTADAEYARQSVLKHYRKIRGTQLVREEEKRLTEAERNFFFKQLKSQMNKDYHDQLARDRIYWLDEAQRKGDVWTTTDAAAFLSSWCQKYISSTRVRMWAVRGWLEYDRDGEHGWYIFRAAYLIDFMKTLGREVREKPELILDQMVRVHAQQHRLGTFKES
jgi:hypothetical protein